jgi:hypothetical protein
MQLAVERRFANGFATVFAYTRSKTINNVGEIPNSVLMNNNCFKCDRSMSFQHVPDLFRCSVRSDIPFGYGRQFFNNGWASRALGGWSIGSLWPWDNGFPLVVSAPNKSNSFVGGNAMRPMPPAKQPS